MINILDKMGQIIINGVEYVGNRLFITNDYKQTKESKVVIDGEEKLNDTDIRKLTKNGSLPLHVEIKGQVDLVDFVGNSLTIHGNVEGDIDATGNSIDIKGDVNCKEIDFTGNTMSVGKDIKGNVDFTGTKLNCQTIHGDIKM